jgi:hypothetical protein
VRRVWLGGPCYMLCVALLQVVAVEDDGLKFKLQLILHLGLHRHPAPYPFGYASTLFHNRQQ